VSRATNGMGIIVPSPLAGEGGSMLPRAMMGEGHLSRQPLTHSSLWAYHCALSRKGRGHERRRPRFWPNEPNHHFGQTNPTCLTVVVLAQAGTHDHRPVFMGPGSRCARPGRRSVGSRSRSPDGAKRHPKSAEKQEKTGIGPTSAALAAASDPFALMLRDAARVRAAPQHEGGFGLD
jgi:hypothetical protein